jgi:hypothetical protein
MEEIQILLPLFDDIFHLDVLLGKCITLGQVMRRDHVEILGRDNLRFITENWERDTRIRHEKSCPVCRGEE